MIPKEEGLQLHGWRCWDGLPWGKEVNEDFIEVFMKTRKTKESETTWGNSFDAMFQIWNALIDWRKQIQWQL